MRDSGCVVTIEIGGSKKEGSAMGERTYRRDRWGHSYLD